MGIIYKATNNINNKIYIGQTVKDLNYRAKEHRREALYSYQNLKRKLTYFHFAILEYGYDNFTFEIIEECDDNNLDDREKYWISYYDSNDFRKGYNMTSGGQDWMNKSNNKKYDSRIMLLDKILKYDIEGNLLHTYENIKEAAKDNNISEAGIRGVYYKEGWTCGGFQWRKENSDIPVGKTKKFLKQEKQKSKDLKKQKIKEKIIEKENDIEKENKERTEKLKAHILKDNNRIRMEVYDKKTNMLLTRYSYQKDLIKDLNITDGVLNTIIKKKQGIYKNIIIKKNNLSKKEIMYKEDEQRIQNLKKHVLKNNNVIHVEVYDKDSNILLTKYSFQKDLAKDLNINISSLTYIIKEKQGIYKNIIIKKVI